MTGKKTWITITILTVLLIAAILYNIYIPAKSNQESKDKIILLQTRNNDLEIKLTSAEKELTETRHKLTGANQEIEQVTIKYLADELYITELESRYMKVYDYALMAQEILVAQGIEFRMVEGGLNYEKLLEDNEKLKGETNEQNKP